MPDWNALVRRRLREMNLAGRRQPDIEAELAQHLEQHYAELLQAGCPEESAEAQLVAELESEATRLGLVGAAGSEPAGFWRRLIVGSDHDARLAVRRLLKRPWFAVAAVVIMGLGLGANTLVFSIVNDVLLKPLPFREPERLFLLHQRTGASRFPQLSFPDYLDLRQAEIFEDAAALWIESWTASDFGRPERIVGLAVTANLLEVLGLQPALGRGPLPDDVGAESPVVIVSHRWWQTRWGGDNVVGTTLTLDGTAHTVIGVLPSDFSLEIPLSASFMIPDPEILTLLDTGWARLQSRKFSSFEVIARSRSGLDRDEIDEGLRLKASQLEAAYPDSNGNRRFDAVPLPDHLVAGTKTMLVVLWGSVAAVLLIACSNLAGVLMSQSDRRAREIRTRLALGATPGLLARQQLAEGALLAGLGAGLGLLLAWWGQPIVLSLAPPDLPRFEGASFGWQAAAFVLLLAGLTLLAFTLQPLAAIRRRSLAPADTGARVAARLSPSRRLLVVAQFSLTFALLTGALLFSARLYSLSRIAPGFDIDHLYTFGLSLSPQRYEETSQVLAFYERLRTEIGAIPGVDNVGFVSSLPLSGHSTGTGVRVEGRPRGPGEPELGGGWQVVLPGYFEAIGIPLLAGRDFAVQDLDGDRHRTIINAALARQAFGEDSPVGRRLAFGPDHEPDWHEVIGVVADVRHLGLAVAPEPRAYDLYGQHGGYGMRAVVRSRRPAESLTPLIRRTVQELDGEVPVTAEFTMAELVRQQTSRERFMMTLSAAFALMAALVAGFGVYSMLSLAVGQRRHEIGIRQAVGATAADIRGLVLRVAGVLVGTGLVAGLFLVWLMSLGLESLDSGEIAAGPALIAGAGVLLLLTGLAGSIVPAIRASRIDPLRCLGPE